MSATKKELFSSGVCDRIRALVVERRLTNYELATKSDVSYKTIYSIMHNKTAPQSKVIGRIAAALNVSCDWLLTGNGSPENQAISSSEPRSPQTIRETSPDYGVDINGGSIPAVVKEVARQLRLPETLVAEKFAKCFGELIKESLVR